MSESILKEYYTAVTGWERNKILIEGRKNRVGKKKSGGEKRISRNIMG